MTTQARAPLFALCQLGLPDTSVAEDIELSRRISADGLGVDVNKLDVAGDDAAVLDMMRRHDVAASACVPSPMSILPMAIYGGPDDIDERSAMIVDGIRRLAKFDPDCVLILTGPPLPGDTDADSRERVLPVLDVAAKEARDCGVRLALEPMRSTLGSSLVRSPDEAIQLLDEVGAHDAGIVFDTWHMWDLPDVAQQIERNGRRIYNVQINDYRPPRTFADRFLPGDGQINWSELLGNLIRAGYQGYFDLEVFSDDGRYGVELPDSLYKTDIAEWTGRGRKQFLELYKDAARAVRSG